MGSICSDQLYKKLPSPAQFAPGKLVIKWINSMNVTAIKIGCRCRHIISPKVFGGAILRITIREFLELLKCASENHYFKLSKFENNQMIIKYADFIGSVYGMH
jgi:hypothetical protein